MQFIAFIIIFGVIVLVHEFGHFYFAKKSGILVREFAIGMGPKIFAHVGKDGTAYTIRILPLGGYVRMAGWGEDSTEIKIGTPVSLTLNQEGTVVRINLSGKNIDQTALPMNVTSFDFEDKLEITGIVLEETKTSPLDVQYQNASIWGRLITNFAGPMNNFILSIVVYSLLAFMRGGAVDYYSNHVQVVPQGVVAKAGLKDNDQIVQINQYKISNWEELTDAVQKATDGKGKNPEITIRYERDEKTQEVTVKPEEDGGRYYIGVTNAVKTGFFDKLFSGVTDTWYTATRIFTALKDIIFHFSLNKLGGPVAIYKASSQAAELGLPAILSLMAMLSINIGIFNLIPIPALDGGKILINLIELVRRKPLKQEVETYLTLAGVAVMVILMIAVTWNDIMKLFLK